MTQLAHGVDGEPTLMASYAYDELGREREKVLDNRLDIIHKAYNMQGRLTDQQGTFFRQQLYYENSMPEAGNVARYGGDISGQRWRHHTGPGQLETYLYDPFGRLSKAINHSGNDEELTYDLSGNILTLKRSGINQDDLRYQYFGNQVSSINGLTYGYDGNGNVAASGLEKLTFGYNLLNLPATVSRGDTTLSYGYTSDGQKRQKVYQNATTQYYRGSMVYDGGGNAEYLITPEALVRKTPGGWLRQYHLTDHLGNVRSLVSESGDTLQKTDYYPFGLAHSYGNLTKNKYLYGGKELQDERFGLTPLNLYDFGARFYNPKTGGWYGTDLLAEKYYSISPYAYCANNPILYVDPDGKEPGLWDTVVEYLTSFFSQAKPGHNEELYEGAYVKNDKEAQKEIQQAETVQTVLDTELTPYVSVSLGKESGGAISGWAGITLTPSGIYFSIGSDISAGAPGIGTGVSVSTSIGLFVGPTSGISGAGLGFGGGSILGISGSTPIGVDKTYGAGITITNSPAWGSTNIGYTIPIVEKKK